MTLASLPRDAEVHWCPNSKCLVLLEEPSIEDTRVDLVSLSHVAPRTLPAIDEKIRNAVRHEIGNAEIIFYSLSVAGWSDNTHVLLVAQARYVRPPENAPANVVTIGFFVNAADGTIERRLSSQEVREKYGFSKDNV
jgi:hypothetical protein